MKAYTSLEQSKKLSEILPLESADMFCADVFNKEKETHSYNFHILSTWGCNTFEELKDRENKFLCFIPVWSIAALLEVLPKNYGRYTKSLYWFDDGWHCEYVDEDGEGYIGKTADNPVDACVAIIEKLHELKML